VRRPVPATGRARRTAGLLPGTQDKRLPRADDGAVPRRVAWAVSDDERRTGQDRPGE